MVSQMTFHHGLRSKLSCILPLLLAISWLYFWGIAISYIVHGLTNHSLPYLQMGGIIALVILGPWCLLLKSAYEHQSAFSEVAGITLSGFVRIDIALLI